MLKERKRDTTDRAKLFQKAGPQPCVGAGMVCRDGLVKARQR
jgi:hypothetical protein